MEKYSKNSWKIYVSEWITIGKRTINLCYQKSKEINLQYAQIQALHLGGTHTGPINADGLEIKSFAYLLASEGPNPVLSHPIHIVS